MTEAPKKIWVDEGMIAWAEYAENETPYIRADIVDELMAACIKTIEENLHLADGDVCTLIHLKRAIAKARGEG